MSGNEGNTMNVYETISRRLFGFARWHLTTVRDDPALADIYVRSSAGGVTKEDIAALRREAVLLSQASRGDNVRPARSEAALLVSVCLDICYWQDDPGEADMNVFGFANSFCIAKAAKQGLPYDANSREGRAAMAETITSVSKWCPEYGVIEAPHLAHLTKLVEAMES